MINNRKNDMAVEREIALFFDKHLYSNTDLFTEFIRTDSLNEQISGSDLLLSTKNNKLNRSIVDEKVASRYANRDLKTFCLELSFIGRGGKKRCGWLLDETTKTEYYLFGWILKADIPYIEGEKRYDTDKITKDNIKSIQWALVKRSDIIEFLENKGWTLERLSEQAEKMRKQDFLKTKEFIDGLLFSYSNSYFEKSITVLLKKETYINISRLHGIIEI